MNVLVTGGSGYVGSALVPLLAKTHRVRVLETMAFGNPIVGTEGVDFMKGDITDPGIVWAAMRDMDAVIHLAGIVTDDLVDLNKDYGYRDNVEATSLLVGTAVSHRVKAFIFASSSSVYGYAAGGDGKVTEAVTPEPQTAYARQKLEAESLLDSKRMRTVAVRSATCMGPAPRMRLDTVVNVFSKQAYFDKKITVHGGEQYRSNVHVEDVAQWYKFALENEIAGVYNVTETNMKVRQIAYEVAGAALSFGLERPEVVIQDVPDPRSYRLDASKAKATGWMPKKGIYQAALDNFEWFKAGGITDPNSDVYYNTKRMKETVTRAR